MINKFKYFMLFTLVCMVGLATDITYTLRQKSTVENIEHYMKISTGQEIFLGRSLIDKNIGLNQETVELKELTDTHYLITWKTHHRGHGRYEATGFILFEVWQGKVVELFRDVVFTCLNNGLGNHMHTQLNFFLSDQILKICEETEQTFTDNKPHTGTILTKLGDAQIEAYFLHFTDFKTWNFKMENHSVRCESGVRKIYVEDRFNVEELAKSLNVKKKYKISKTHTVLQTPLSKYTCRNYNELTND